MTGLLAIVGTGLLSTVAVAVLVGAGLLITAAVAVLDGGGLLGIGVLVLVGSGEGDGDGTEVLVFVGGGGTPGVSVAVVVVVRVAVAVPVLVGVAVAVSVGVAVAVLVGGTGVAVLVAVPVAVAVAVLVLVGGTGVAVLVLVDCTGLAGSTAAAAVPLLSFSDRAMMSPRRAIPDVRAGLSQRLEDIGRCAFLTGQLMFAWEPYADYFVPRPCKHQPLGIKAGGSPSSRSVQHLSRMSRTC